jgi:hypothetical protein
MPTTKSENLYFGLIMCFGMVLVMSIYNLSINGALGSISNPTVLIELGIGFIIALALDLYIVGPIAKAITFKLPFDKSKKIYVVLSMSTCMVIGMASCMSVFGLITSGLAHGLNAEGIFYAYLMVFLKNIIVAYPLQFLVIGPLVRLIFVKFIKSNKLVVSTN